VQRKSFRCDNRLVNTLHQCQGQTIRKITLDLTHPMGSGIVSFSDLHLCALSLPNSPAEMRSWSAKGSEAEGCLLVPGTRILRVAALYKL
jgi:hypothetical protein